MTNVSRGSYSYTSVVRVIFLSLSVFMSLSPFVAILADMFDKEKSHCFKYGKLIKLNLNHNGGSNHEFCL